MDKGTQREYRWVTDNHGNLAEREQEERTPQPHFPPTPHQAEQDRKPEEKELNVATVMGPPSRVQKQDGEEFGEDLGRQREYSQNIHNNPI